MSIEEKQIEVLKHQLKAAHAKEAQLREQRDIYMKEARASKELLEKERIYFQWRLDEKNFRGERWVLDRNDLYALLHEIEACLQTLCGYDKSLWPKAGERKYGDGTDGVRCGLLFVESMLLANYEYLNMLYPKAPSSIPATEKAE